MNIDHIQRIRDLRLILKTWSLDKEYIKKGGKIYYAVDSDIIKMYSNPDEVYKYLRVLSTDDNESLKLLSRSVSNFMFNDSGFTFLSIKPHYDEVIRIIYAIMLASANDVKSSLSNLNAIKNKLDNTNNSIEEVFDLLEKNTELLIRYLLGEEVGHIAEMQKINYLLGEKIININDYKENIGDDKWEFPDLNDNWNIIDKQKLVVGCDKWYKLLVLQPASQTPIPDDKVERYRYNKAIDAEVLTRIEYINNEIKNLNKKLLLITGDSKIHRAAKAEGFEYIRDPKMFFASPNLFKTDNKYKNQNRLIDWLETSLAGIHGDKSNKDVEKFIKKNKRAIIINIQEFKSTWDTYVRRNLLDYGIRSNKNKKTDIKNFIANHSYDEILDIANKKVLNTWYESWRLSFKFGTWAISQLDCADHQTNKPERNIFPKRGLPALKLTFCATNTKLEELYKTLSHQSVLSNPKTFINLTKEDKSDYGAFLLYALAFGSAGKWNISYILSKIALNIAEYITQENQVKDEPITGNEAAYLCAWSSRQCAENISMLNNARKYIKKAQEKKLLATGTGYDLRYECEDNAIIIAYSIYNMFLDPNSISDEQFFSITSCRDRLKTIIIEEQNLVNSEYESLMIKRQAYTYYYISNLLISQRFKKGINEEEKEFAQTNITIYRDVLNNAVYPIQTCINKIIYLVSYLIFGGYENKETVIDEIKEDYLLERIKNCYVSPYDQELYKFLYQVAECYF